MVSKRTQQAIQKERDDPIVYATNRWKPLPGHPEYEVSDTGLVVRVAPARTRTVPYVLIGHVSKKGYKFYKLQVGKRKVKYTVSRLVLLAWVGPPERDDYYACHNDGNPRNNNLSNLRWDTPAGNAADKNKHGTSLHGDRNGRVKMTWEKVRNLRMDHENGHTGAELSRKYNLAITQTYEIIHKESWWPDAGK